MFIGISVGPKSEEVGVCIDRGPAVGMVTGTVLRDVTEFGPSVSLVLAFPKGNFTARSVFLGTRFGRCDDLPYIVFFDDE